MSLLIGARKALITPPPIVLLTGGFGTPVNLGSAVLYTSVSQLPILTAVDINIGDTIAVGVWFNHSVQNINDCGDAVHGVNSYTAGTQLALAAGRMRMFYKKATSFVPASTAITPRFSIANGSGKAACAIVIPGMNTLDQGITGAGATSSAPSPGAIPASGSLAENREMALMSCWYTSSTTPNRDGFSVGSSVSTFTNQYLELTYKLLTSNAQITPLWSMTSGVWGAQAMTFTEAP